MIRNPASRAISLGFVAFVFFFVAALRAQPVTDLTFATKAEAESATVPADTIAIRTLGYHEPGKGAALYRFVGTTAPTFSPRGEKDVPRPRSHYIAAKAGANVVRYFVLSEETPDVSQFGAIADSTTDGKATGQIGGAKAGGEAFDNTAAFNDAFRYGKSLFVPAGKYWVKGTLRILEDGTKFYGDGPGGGTGAGAEIYFGPGKDDCIVLGNGTEMLRWAKVERLYLEALQRTGGNMLFVDNNYQFVADELRINYPWNGIKLYRGLGFTIRNLMMSRIRCGDGDANGPKEIGYGIKMGGAPELWDEEGKKVKRDTHVLYVENISFGSLKVETDPTNWTVGLWAAENAASINGATVKNQNVRHAILINRAANVDAKDQLMVPAGYTLVPKTWTDTAGTKGDKGKTYNYGSPEYPAKPKTVIDDNGRFQDMTLFYVGGDFLGGEYVYFDEGTSIAIHNPHFFRVYQGNSVYMGPKARDFTIFGGQVIGPYKNGFDMNGSRWHISGVQIYKPSLDSDREKHKGKFSGIRVGPTSVGGDVVNCKIGNEPEGTPGRVGSTAKHGLVVEKGARGTWYHGNRFEGNLHDNVVNNAGDETQAGTNFMGPTGR